MYIFHGRNTTLDAMHILTDNLYISIPGFLQIQISNTRDKWSESLKIKV